MGSWPYPDVDPEAGSFDLPDLAAPAQDPVPVRVRVYGYTEHTHTVTATLNGLTVGQTRITGRASGLIEGAVPASSLLALGNRLGLDYSAEPLEGTPPDEPGGIFLDHVDIDIPTWSPRLEPTAVESYEPGLPRLSGVEYLIITHPDFKDAAATIAGAKQAEGLSTAILTTDEIYDSFSSGFVEARAIQAAIRSAARTSAALRFVLLIGDDSYDNNDFVGTGVTSFLPSLLFLDPIYGRVPSENRYADLDDDGLPDLAIGRLPVQSLEQARTVADKIVRQGEWLSLRPAQHLLAADNSNAEDGAFAEEADEMAGLLPPGLGFSGPGSRRSERRPPGARAGLGGRCRRGALLRPRRPEHLGRRADPLDRSRPAARLGPQAGRRAQLGLQLRLVRRPLGQLGQRAAPPHSRRRRPRDLRPGGHHVSRRAAHAVRGLLPRAVRRPDPRGGRSPPPSAAPHRSTRPPATSSKGSRCSAIPRCGSRSPPRRPTECPTPQTPRSGRLSST